jgi:hypothetical protein
MSAGSIMLRSRWEGRYSIGSSISGSESLTSSMRAWDIFEARIVGVGERAIVVEVERSRDLGDRKKEGNLAASQTARCLKV